jgi:single-strand DNA-binding protein
MAGSYNHSTFIGNLTRDPEARKAGDQEVAGFTIAVNKKSKGKEDKVLYIACTAWRKTGEICLQYLKKGMSVLVNGEMDVREYEKKDGTKAFSIDLTVDDRQGMIILDKKSDGAHTDSASHGNGQPAATASSGDEAPLDADEIPF